MAEEWSGDLLRYVGFVYDSGGDFVGQRREIYRGCQQLDGVGDQCGGHFDDWEFGAERGKFERRRRDVPLRQYAVGGEYERDCVDAGERELSEIWIVGFVYGGWESRWTAAVSFERFDSGCRD